MTVVVVGGGITGLASAHALGAAGVPTLLLESGDRLGGKVRTERVEGFLLEHGPDSFVSYRPAALRLATALGVAGDLIRPLEPRTVQIRTGGRLRRFPDGMGLVLPTRFLPFATSDLFSPLEKLRMGLDLLLPREHVTGDRGVGPFLRRRLGAALVDRLAGPLIGGVYGTAIDDLSIDAVVPQLRTYEREHRSLLLASLAEGRTRRHAAKAAAATGSPPAPPPAPFVSLGGGTQQLIDALAAAVRAMPSVEIRIGAEVEGVESGRGAAEARVRLAGGETVDAEAVVLATPAPVTRRLVGGIAPAVVRALEAIPHGTTAVVNLAYRDDQLPADLAGHGFLVAQDEPLTISAATLSSRKWAGRAPDGTLLVRAFIGSRRPEAHRGPDAALIAAAHADVAECLGIRGEPILARIARFPDAMPQYTVGHLGRVAAAEAALAPFPALRLAGGAYRGVGLPDCIAQGVAAADAVLGRLGGAPAADAGPDQPDAEAGRGDASLGSLPVGATGTVRSVQGEHRAELGLEGVHVGTRIAVATRAPLGGPVVVQVGRAWVAVDRAIAAGVVVALDGDERAAR